MRSEFGQAINEGSMMILRVWRFMPTSPLLNRCSTLWNSGESMGTTAGHEGCGRSQYGIILHDMKVQSLTRAFDIVEALSREQHGLPLTEIANRLDLPQSTTYRLLSALEERGSVEQAGRSGVYRLGLAFIDLSSLYLNRLELKTEAAPFLQELSQKTGQTVFLATRDRDQIVYIEKFNSLRKYSIIGQRKPVYATSLGKSLLLGLTDTEIRDVPAETTFEKLGLKTITDLARLLYEIGISRERGWTFDDEEAESGVRCVAAPVYDYRGHVIAAVSTSWSLASNESIDIPQFAGYVREATRSISIHMGFRERES